ncbi:MAG: ferric reductase-like transmembrane domain-containing protein [Proteobacteria bacterium]|nr:ferric reductase-like transmembrane domain-containing protein [Pseudomonadota bacterium]
MKWPLIAYFLIGTVVIVIAGALAIPFVYESQTLWYKLGSDKTVLRAGQLVGLLALASLLIQILLGARGSLLQETFGVVALMAWHKANGILLCCLAVLHVVLVLVPEGLANLPLGTKNWPEMVGGVLLLVIFSQAISSLFRQQIGFIYKQWRTVHRTLGYVALCLAAVHVLFVADSFAQGVPRRALLAILVTVFVVVLAVKFAPFMGKLRDKR